MDTDAGAPLIRVHLCPSVVLFPQFTRPSNFPSVFGVAAAIIWLMNEWQLVAAYARGDEQAFADLVRRYFSLVYSAAARQVGDAHLAEEIAQSVFILFARKAATLSPSVSLTGWFLRTTRFVARDALKQMNRRMKKERAAAELAALHEGWQPDWNSAAHLVDEALLGLSKSEQACVMARFFDGLTFKAIGDACQISEDAAQKRVVRALDKMRAFLLRRGVTVSSVIITGILGANLAKAGEAQLVQAALANVQAALHGQASVSGLWLANHVARSLARRAAIAMGVGVTAAILLIVGGLVLWNRIISGPPTSFQVSDNRIDALGRAWALVAQRAAFIVSFPQGGPPAGSPNRAAYDQATAFVLTETTRVSTELDRVLQEGRDRERLAEFLTVELRETLGLDAGQQAVVLAELRARLGQGATFRDGLQALWDARTEFGARLRQQLSPEQMQRFNRTYGANAIGLLAFPKLVLSSGG